jgi:tRNA(fMet)-specific endonuclease VapC
MSGSYILDTSVVINFLNNDPPIVTKVAAATQLFLPSIVLGALYYGAFRSKRPAENTQQILAFSNTNTGLACDEISAQHYAAIKNQLRLKGKPIPENDIWIAAVSMHYHRVLATRDGHFEEIDDLAVEMW